MTTNFTQALFIRLGKGNSWAEKCFDEHFIHLNYHEIHHELANGLPENFYKVLHEAQNVGLGKNDGASRNHVNQICKFYESDEQVLWFTFHANRLWWCFSKHEVTPEIVDGTELGQPELIGKPVEVKRRAVITKWSDKNDLGETLFKSKLSGKLLKTEGFRGTICTLSDDVQDYLRHKINGTVDHHVQQAKDAQQALSSALIQVIQSLHYTDFEILVDLIFMHGGWRRVGISGGTEKDIDLDLESPITGERIAVQVKSSASVDVWNKYRQIAQTMKNYSRFYFVTHSSSLALREAASDHDSSRYKYWDADELARQVIRSGLTGWVLDKAA